jgi:hypothetical protein
VFAGRWVEGCYHAGDSNLPPIAEADDLSPLSPGSQCPVNPANPEDPVCPTRTAAACRADLAAPTSLRPADPAVAARPYPDAARPYPAACRAAAVAWRSAARQAFAELS